MRTILALAILLLFAGCGSEAGETRNREELIGKHVVFVRNIDNQPVVTATIIKVYDMGSLHRIFKVKMDSDGSVQMIEGLDIYFEVQDK